MEAQNLTTGPQGSPSPCAALRTTLRNLNGRRGDISQQSLRVGARFYAPREFLYPIQYPDDLPDWAIQLSMNFVPCRPGYALAKSKDT